MVPSQEKYERALRRASVKVVTPDWVLDCVSEKSRKDEAAYHPRLIIYEEEEEEEDDDEEEEEEEEAENDGSTDEKSSAVSSREGSPATGRHFSPPGPPKKGQEKEELMFDDSSDSSPEKQERNLNWTPAEIPQVATAKRRLVPGKEPGLINLCANVPPVPGGALPPDGRPGLLASGQPLQGAERPGIISTWSTARTLRNITNSTDVQPGGRPSNVAQVSCLAWTREPWCIWESVAALCRRAGNRKVKMGCGAEEQWPWAETQVGKGASVNRNSGKRAQNLWTD